MDLVVDLESTAFEAGRTAGREAAKEDLELLAIGERAGALKAFSLGFEVGFYTTSTKLRRSALGDDTVDDEAVKLVSTETNTTSAVSSTVTTRAIRRATELTALAEGMPGANDGEYDFDASVGNMRAQYRQLGSPNGQFPPRLDCSGRPILESKDPEASSEW